MCCLLCATTAIEEARFLREDLSICLGDGVHGSGCFDCSISGSGVFLDYKLTHIFIAALAFERQNAIGKDSGNGLSTPPQPTNVQSCGISGCRRMELFNFSQFYI